MKISDESEESDGRDGIDVSDICDWSDISDAEILVVEVMLAMGVMLVIVEIGGDVGDESDVFDGRGSQRFHTPPPQHPNILMPRPNTCSLCAHLAIIETSVFFPSFNTWLGANLTDINCCCL